MPTAVPSAVADLRWSPERPAALCAIDGAHLLGREDVALVEIFTAEEQRARTSQAYVRSAVGSRLRVVDSREWNDGASRRLVIVQRDDASGVETHTTLTRPHGTTALRIETTVVNTSSAPLVITAVSSVSFGLADTESLEGLHLGFASSEWLAENRWREVPLVDVLPPLELGFHGQDARGHFGITSHGAWSSGEFLPSAYAVHEATGTAAAWQIETSAGWHMDFSATRGGAVVSLLGPTDLEHQFARRLDPGESFDAVPVALAVSTGGRDGAIAELTAYRRWAHDPVAAGDELPVVYNDFMNTLMGQPSTAALLPLIREAAEAGAEVFCVDAGWFADPAIGDWWDTVGDWKESPQRFTAGLAGVVDEIRARGLRAGIWLEPEVVGVKSLIAEQLPDEAFFRRFGQRVVEHNRYHLDLRHPAARAHLDAAVDELVEQYGFSYFKLDYNINPGAGTEWRATTAGDGLLAHTRAFRSWLVDVQLRHPGVLIENCSSGAMRADNALLSVTHLQSTSDQQDFRLYPPIAASAPAHIVPEQCANWAYPAADMSREETVFTLVTGLSGRLYLSGFLDALSSAQRSLVREAVELHKSLRHRVLRAVPFWPLGLPDWDDAIVCMGLRDDDGAILFVWNRGDGAAEIVVPGLRGQARQEFPADDGWTIEPRRDGLAIRTLPGVSARVITVTAGRGRP